MHLGRESYDARNETQRVEYLVDIPMNRINNANKDLQNANQAQQFLHQLALSQAVGSRDGTPAAKSNADRPRRTSMTRHGSAKS